MNLRDLPKVDVLATDSRLAAFPQQVRLDAARAAIGRMRAQIQAGKEPGSAKDLAVSAAEAMMACSLDEVINGSGVVLHTGAGRARLAPFAAEQIAKAARGHASVEIDLESGRRGDRQARIRALLLELTGAEDALVVNNNAGAVFLALHALAGGREVILSRGEMVEIGGSFRLPDIVRESGCRLVEVGCTNKTHLKDFERAIGPDTAAILRCHPSNFKVVGFSEAPSPAELADLCRKRGILMIDDVGSGCLVDLGRWGLPAEPTLPQSVASGAHVVMASGDKLLGGPQAGILLGKSEPLGRMRSHPLARALRIDKLTAAALEATLMLYSQGREMELPTLAYLSRSQEEVKMMAERIAARVKGAEVLPSITETGGGSMPGTGIPTWCAVFSPADPDAFARALRLGKPAVLGRIQADKVWLDPRTMEPEEVAVAAERVSELA